MQSAMLQHQFVSQMKQVALSAVMPLVVKDTARRGGSETVQQVSFNDIGFIAPAVDLFTFGKWTSHGSHAFLTCR
jgi:hypothetical protein